MNNWLKVSAAVLPLSLASVAASAGVIGLGFDTTGSAAWGKSCGPSCTDLNLKGTTTVSGLEYFGPSSNFSFSALLDVTSNRLGDLSPTGTWQLQDGSGDTIYGSVDGSLSGWAGHLSGWGTLDFSITGGTGLFDNISGSGGSMADFSANGGFSDSGLVWIGSPSSPPSTVSEPGTLGLFVVALGALAWSTRRRRATLIGNRAELSAG